MKAHTRIPFSTEICVVVTMDTPAAEHQTLFQMACCCIEYFPHTL